MHELVFNLWTYTIGGCLLFMLLERLRPARQNRPLRSLRGLSDVANLLFFNAFSIGLYALASQLIEPTLWAWVAEAGFPRLRYQLQVLNRLPLVTQAIALLLLLDLLEWLIHRLMHLLPPLWYVHKIHHSVQGDEMSFWASQRVHWLETVLRRSLLYLPLLALSVRWEVLVLVRASGLLMEMLIHSNLRLRLGPLRYLLNSPQMHAWHHARDGAPHDLRWNFGSRFIIWDLLFGTAYIPPDEDSMPEDFGFDGDERIVNNVLGHQLYPLLRQRPQDDP